MKIDLSVRILDALIALLLLIFPHFLPLPFYLYAVVWTIVIVLYQRWKKQSLRDLGVLRSGITKHVLWIGLVSAVALALFMQYVYLPTIFRFFDVPDYTEYDFIRKHPLNLVITIAAAWLVAGFYEELVFRGFIHHAIQDCLGAGKYSFWIAGAGTTFLFGLYHWQQGIYGIISSMIAGAFWTFLLNSYHGNLWYTIAAHALYDTILLILIYYGLFGR